MTEREKIFLQRLHTMTNNIECDEIHEAVHDLIHEMAYPWVRDSDDDRDHKLIGVDGR